MTDPKRITLPGPGSQPSHPAPEPPPSDAHATAVLGTFPSGTPVERSVPPAEEQNERPGFNPFKFQRITVPPGLRADMIRWSREGKAERLPGETIPPGEVDEAGLESTSAESDDAGDPGSMTPVGGSTAPRLPLRSVRGLALAASLVILPLAVLGLASALRRQPSADANLHEATEPAFGAQTQATPPAPRAVAPIAPAETTTEATPPESTTPAATPPSSAAAVSTTPRPPSKPARREAAGSVRPTTRPARPVRSAEPAPTAAPNENALDRPFSLPK